MAEINFQKLEEHVQKLVRAQGSDSEISITPVSAETISASINLTNKKIQFEIPSGWDPTRYKNIEAFAKKLRLRSPKTKVVEDISFHEIGHDKLKNDRDGLGCPEDLKGKEIAVDTVSKAMLEQNKFSQQGALYLENCISDIINNLNGSRYTSLNGLSMFFAEQGELNQKFSPLYEAFVKLNMYLSGRRKQKKLLKPYHTDAETVDEVVAGCIKDINLTKSKEQNLSILFNRSNWQNTFYTFAKHLAKLMDQNSPESLPGTGSEGYKIPAEFDSEARFDPEDIDDPVMKRVLDKDNMKKVMQRRNVNGEDLPSFVENWRALNYFYDAEASELYIKAESPKKGQAMPIAPIQARQFDADKDSLENILFGRILLDENGKPCLAVPRSYVEHTAKYKKTVKSYPELNIAVLDNSISMTQAANDKGAGRTNIVPWGDNSKYHYSVLAYKGVEKALHRMGVGTRTRYNMITFAAETSATGEKSYEDKADIMKRVLNPVFGNTTEIDADVLAKHTREPGSVLMTISDGQIWNWDDVKDDFKRTISDKFYVHFQIGEDNQATRDLESWGATVVRIADASQMPRKAIDIAQSFYKSYAATESVQVR